MCVKILNRRTVVHLYDKNTDAVDQPALGMAPILKKEFLKLFSWKVIILEIYVIYFHESYYLGINVKYFPWKSLSWKLM